MGVACKNCGGTTIDSDVARGDSACVNCGSVVESLCIVNEVEFQENSAGNASVIGQFVSAEGHYTNLGENFKYGIGRDHRQIILDNDMLLDICDIVQCDVIALGRVFLQLARELCIDCPIVDPSLYIHRFANQLDFGEHENEVSMTALRIMARMKKDWIHFGRRPSALCGAALIIAGKLHGFSVTMNDIVKLVRMSKTTVFKRLNDFSKTATGKLTTEEFKTVDLEEEADPPCYTEGRIRKKFAQEMKEDGKEFKVSLDVLSQVVKTQEKLKILLDKRKNIKSEITATDHEAKEFDYRAELPQDYSLYSYELDEKGEFTMKRNVIHEDDEDNDIEVVERNKPTTASSTLLLEKSIKKDYNGSARKDAELAKESDEIDLEGIDDEEIDKLLLTEEEIAVKTKIWLEENREYLMKIKAREEELKRKEEEDSKNGVKKKRKPTKRKQKEHPICETADEAIKTMLAEKKLSSKINYDVLRGLKDEENKEMENDFNVVKNESSILDEESLKSEGDIMKVEDDKAFVKAEKELKLHMETVYESGPVEKAKKKRGNVLPTFSDSKEDESKKSKLSDNTNEVQSSSKTKPLFSSKPTPFSSMFNDDLDEELEDDLIEEEDDDAEMIRASSLFAKEVDEFDNYEYDDGDAFY